MRKKILTLKKRMTKENYQILSLKMCKNCTDNPKNTLENGIKLKKISQIESCFVKNAKCKWKCLVNLKLYHELNYSVLVCCYDATGN